MISSLLLRHDLVVLKNKSATDTAQVPAAGALVSVYAAGPRVHTATVLRGQYLDPPPPIIQAIPVDDVRQTMAGDVLQVGTTATQLTVDSVDATHVWVVYDQTDNLVVTQGTILLAITRGCVPGHVEKGSGVVFRLLSTSRPDGRCTGGPRRARTYQGRRVA